MADAVEFGNAGRWDHHRRHPPVNALGQAVRQGLVLALGRGWRTAP